MVVVGGGIAAAHVAEGLRDGGHADSITIIGAEPYLPYERPPLSKAVLLQTAAPESAIVHDQAWYDDREVTVLTGTAVTDADRSARSVRVGREAVPYDHLVLATGARARAYPGAPDGLVHTLRSVYDAREIRDRLSGRVVIIGGGWIGLEVAAAAVQRGAHVLVVEPAAAPLARVLGERVAGSFAALHREHGVDLRLSTTITSVRRNADSTLVALSDHSSHRADLVVAGIGAVPEVALAQALDLPTDNGVLVDARLTTVDPTVLAIGDVANHDHPRLGRIRVEHWDNAIEQGRHAARVILGSRDPYDHLPFFFSDQYDLGMEYLGTTAGGYDDVVVRGDLTDDRVFTALWLRGDHVVAGMHANDWAATEHLRRLVGAHATRATRDAGVALADL